VLVLEENPDLNYLQAIFEDEDVDAFRDRVIKSGSLAGLPVRLSDGRQVGQVLSGGAWPFEFTASDGETYDGAAIVEMRFESADFLKVASEAEITLTDDAVLLLGDEAGDVAEPVAKSYGDQLSQELRAGWQL
jgi:hypothetical protein